MASSEGEKAILLVNPRGRVVDVMAIRRYRIMKFDPNTRRNIEEVVEEDMLSEYLAQGYRYPTPEEEEQGRKEIYGSPKEEKVERMVVIKEVEKAPEPAPAVPEPELAPEPQVEEVQEAAPEADKKGKK